MIIIPHPTPLKIRQLGFPGFNIFKDILQGLLGAVKSCFRSQNCSFSYGNFLKFIGIMLSRFAIQRHS